jgi:hypothetical protein
VARSGESEEQLFAAGPRGSQDASWISPGAEYEFRLYAVDSAESLLSAITVRGTTVPAAVSPASLHSELPASREIDEAAELLAQSMPPFASAPLYEKFFPLWEEHGFHLTPVHFYQPIPDTRTLATADWDKDSELVGIDMRDEAQLDLLRNAFPRFRSEFEAFPLERTDDPSELSLDNPLFSGTDALVLYCMVRHFKPKSMIEIGAGFSTRLSALAARRNQHTRLVSIEPYPDEGLKQGVPGLSELIERPVQDIEPALFEQLKRDDILFVDTSHVVRVGGDVNYLILEILPRLQSGVIVHFHDIFLPRDYPREWVLENYRFWTEQYLLHAFLSYNTAYEVLFANHYVGLKYGDLMRKCFPRSPWWGGLSFWMRRVGSRGSSAE